MSQTHPEGRAFLLLQAEAWEVCVGTGEAHGGQALHLHPAPYLCHLHRPAQVGVSELCAGRPPSLLSRSPSCSGEQARPRPGLQDSSSCAAGGRGAGGGERIQPAAA